MQFKQQVFEMLNDEHSKYFSGVSIIIAFFALASLVLVLAEIFPYITRYERALFLIDWWTTIFFTIEYALRFWVADKRWEYVQSPLGLIDLLSFIPTYLGIGNFSFLKATRFVRVARLSRIANVSNTTKVLPKRDT